MVMRKKVEQGLDMSLFFLLIGFIAYSDIHTTKYYWGLCENGQKLCNL